MTITLDLPGDLEQAIRMRADESGHDVSNTVISLLRHSMSSGNGRVYPLEPLPLIPAPYPDDEPLGLLSDEVGYEAVPLAVAGELKARFVAGGDLIPTPIPDDE